MNCAVFVMKRTMLFMACLAAFSVYAADPADVTRQLEELNSEIVASRAVTNLEQATLEELRQDLYRAAVATRDAKRRSDEIDQLRAQGLLVDVELAQIRGDILNAGVLLRELRDRIDMLGQINQSGQAILDSQADEITLLRKAIIDPAQAVEAAGAELVRSLEVQLDAMRAQLNEKDKNIERLTRENRELKSGSRTTVRTTPARTGGYEANLTRGFDDLAAGKVDDAVLSFKRALSLVPDSEDARTGLAACHFERAEFDAVRQLVDEVLELNDKNARALGVRGALAYRNGNLRDARRILERAIKADKENAYNYNYLGIVLYELGRTEAAIKQIQKAVDIDPDYVSARYNLSILLATDRRPELEAAKIHYEKALSLGSPRNPGLDLLLNIPTP